MFDTYREIFEQRGAQYHQAMQQYPDARSEEFAAIVGMAELAAGQLVLDMPSGGGYLGRYISEPVRLVGVETSREFVRHMRPERGLAVLLCEDLAQQFLPDGCVDRIISLAGVHHLPDKPAFYREALRLLRPGGLFCLADVQAGMPADAFLNGFVDAHSSMGHQGAFLDAGTGAGLRALGFELLREEQRDYHWQFSTADAMSGYCQLLFGIDQADRETIAAGIGDLLGYQSGPGYCRMNWGLRYFKCRRPQ